MEHNFQVERKRMVEDQITSRGVQDQRLLNVMETVPRHQFVMGGDLGMAYADCPLPIGNGQTISQPYMVALMTQLLEVDPADRVLEVGTGSGYQAAVLGLLAAQVHTVEFIPNLALRAAKTLAELGYRNIHVHTGDGSLGWQPASPYNGILVAAGAPSAPPPLLDQLAEGGRLVIPVGRRGYQNLEVWRRVGSEFEHRDDIEVAFVPLVGEYGWKNP